MNKTDFSFNSQVRDSTKMSTQPVSLNFVQYLQSNGVTIQTENPLLSPISHDYASSFLIHSPQIAQSAYHHRGNKFLETSFQVASTVSRKSYHASDTHTKALVNRIHRQR